MSRRTGAGRKGRRVAASVALGLGLVFAAAEARADDASTFDAGQSAYDAGQYGQAEILFRKMLDPKNPPCATASPGEACKVREEFIERARAYMAASLVVLKRPEEADVLFEQILIARPTWEPNQAIYPLSAQQRFLEVKKRLKPRLDEILKEQQRTDQRGAEAQQKAKEEYDAWIQRLERMASQRQLVSSNSRLIAAIPFGVGQFQNRDRSLALVFLTSEVVVGGASIVSGLLANYYASVDPNRFQTVEQTGLKNNLDAALTTNRISFIGWAGLTVIGIVQAQIAFTAYPVTNAPQPRAIPPAPKVDVKVEPIVSAVPHGAYFGVRGSF